jgi:hypothetical protein
MNLGTWEFEKEGVGQRNVLLRHHGLLIEEIFFNVLVYNRLIFYGSGSNPISSGALKLSSITPTPTLAAFFEKKKQPVNFIFTIPYKNQSP